MRKQTINFIGETIAAVALLFAVIIISLILHGCAVKKPKYEVTGSGTAGAPFRIDKFDPVIEHSEIKDETPYRNHIIYECESDCYK